MTNEEPRTETAWYRLILAIRGAAAVSEQTFVERARRLGLPAAYFGVDGWLRDDQGTTFGLYRFVTVNEVREALSTSLPLEAPCPFVGPVGLFLTWEWWEGFPVADDRAQLAELLLGAANGYIARLDDDRRFEAIVARSFSRAALAGGELAADDPFLLDTEEPAYAEHVAAALGGETDPATIWGYNLEGLERGELDPLLEIETSRPWLK